MPRPGVPRVIVTPCSPVLPMFDDDLSSPMSSRQSSPTRHSFDPFLLEEPRRSTRSKRRSSSSSSSRSTSSLSSLRSSRSGRAQALAVAGLGLDDDDEDDDEHDYDSRRVRRSGAISVALLFVAIVLVVSSTICSPSSSLFANHPTAHFDNTYRSSGLFHPYQQRHHQTASSSTVSGGSPNRARLAALGLDAIPELSQKIGSILSTGQKWLASESSLTWSSAKLQAPEAEHSQGSEADETVRFVPHNDIDDELVEINDEAVEIDEIVGSEVADIPSGWDSRRLTKHANGHRRTHALDA